MALSLITQIVIVAATCINMVHLFATDYFDWLVILFPLHWHFIYSAL